MRGVAAAADPTDSLPLEEAPVLVLPPKPSKALLCHPTLQFFFFSIPSPSASPSSSSSSSSSSPSSRSMRPPAVPMRGGAADSSSVLLPLLPPCSVLAEEWVGSDSSSSPA